MARIFKSIGLLLVWVIIALVLWGFMEPYFIDDERYDATVPNLPAAWEGRQVALISDWQVGMWMDNLSTVKRVIERIREARPAAVIITGDFVYHAGDDPQDELEEIVEALRPLGEAAIPTYAVLGNHDYGLSSESGEPDARLARAVDSTLGAAGIRVLRNEAVALGDGAGASALYVVGLDSHWAGRDSIELALSGVPEGAPRIVIMHNPDSYLELPAYTAPLAMAGHTHGGQIRVPYTPEWSWLVIAKGDSVQVDGWIDDLGAAGNRLYVNRGIGFSLMPIRINCMPEVTFFTLRGESR